MILGVSCSHNSTACLLTESGDVVFCASEERFTRRKGEWGFPARTLDYLFTHLCPPAEIKAVSIGESCEHHYGSARLCRLLNLASYAERDDCLRRKSQLLKLGIAELGGRAIGRKVYLRDLLIQALQDRGITAPLTFVDHHTAHAASAWGSAPFQPQVIVTFDGEGDGLSGTVWFTTNDAPALQHRFSADSSIALLYKLTTAFLGFKVNRHEGKVMGLAAYGGAHRFIDLFRHCLSVAVLEKDGEPQITSRAAQHQYKAYTRAKVPTCALLRRIPAIFQADDWEDLVNDDFRNMALDFFCALQEQCDTPLSLQDRADIAASLQAVTEEVVLKVLSHYGHQINAGNLALAGGLFANVRLNQVIAKTLTPSRLHVHPGMGDEGLALGSAWHTWSTRHHQGSIPVRSLMPAATLGPEPSPGNGDAQGFVSILGDDAALARKTAALLAAKKIVGVLRAKAEYGPRALGNRSILAHPGEIGMVAELNQRLGRNDFMPFAPAVLDTCYDEVFEELSHDTVSAAAAFMTISLPVRKEWHALIPAVIHCDGTARPQVLTQSTTPFFYEVVDAFMKQTELPCVLNTSMNIHEEPIVQSVDDGLRLLQSGVCDALTLDDRLLCTAESAQLLADASPLNPTSRTTVRKV